ncbi:homologous-pairing protein 2 homolog [Corythoichthys intestinalis]|uniref:homologous-pairing protein 2 homolog n=1 Tax=Corythoichthys intestinalis TaxID=161448 RepID=UPI0025A67DBB|nr:homologous-pairing protein 2 homolog [Corythoichthys intestinalis]XP_061811779.1 homologous-pairing protein 2 homolog [Nerophis lumbriciformis]
MSKKDNSANVILAYLNAQNRPYNAQDIFCNLQNQHGLGKTAVVKSLGLLAVEGKIIEKTYGKQKIYFANQAQFSEVNDTDIKALDGRISTLNEEMQTLGQSCRQLDSELKKLTSSLTTQEMMSEIIKLKDECSGYRERLDKIKSATNHVSPEEKDKILKEHNIYVKEWQKRKRLASDMIDTILEGYPKSKKEFLEEVGVETDEEHKVVVPTL